MNDKYEWLGSQAAGGYIAYDANTEEIQFERGTGFCWLMKIARLISQCI
jgi:hypothetical protein